jgi:hypothetical protein
LLNEGGDVGLSENDVMKVLVVVAFPDLQTRRSEEAWERDIIDAVSAAVHADSTLDTIAVRQLEYEDCRWVFEGGMPMPDYGVTVGPHGRWHSGIEPFPGNPEARGDDLQSLFDYLAEQGLVSKVTVHALGTFFG